MERITKMNEDPNKEANDMSPIAATDKGMNDAAWRKMIGTKVNLLSAEHPLGAPDYQSKKRLQSRQGMQQRQPRHQQHQAVRRKQHNQPQQPPAQQQQQQQQQAASHQEAQQSQATVQQQQQHTEQAAKAHREGLISPNDAATRA